MFSLGIVPCCANYRKSNTECNAQVCPCVWRYRFEEGADLEAIVSESNSNFAQGVKRAGKVGDAGAYIEGLAAAGEEHI